MLLVLALVVFVVVVPASCALIWTVWLKDLAERTGLSEKLSDTLGSPGVFMSSVVVFGVSLWTFVVTVDPLKAFVFAPFVCALVGAVGSACSGSLDDRFRQAPLPRCATSSFGDLQPAPPQRQRHTRSARPSNAEDRGPLIRLVIGNAVRERPMGWRRRQPGETDESGHRFVVLTPEEREEYLRFLRGEGGDPRD